MSYRETTISFPCEKDMLAGILSLPAQPASTGVLVIVGGPQYRAGSHRQFVLLARALAQQGFSVMRFDYRGMGDSSGAQRDFLQVANDIEAAIDAFRAKAPAVQHIVLWGLCDGASAALLFCQHARRQDVRGLCLLNPWVRSATSLARAHVKHYYRDRLMQKEFWLKFLRGGVALHALAGLWHNIRAMRADGAKAADTAASQLPFQQRMALGWRDFPGSILLLLSESDYTAKEFLEYVRMDEAWKGLLPSPNVQWTHLPGADHTLSDSNSRLTCEKATIQWLRDCMPVP